MRRGHHSGGGWRNDNHRSFRPRTGGSQIFRPSRGFILETPPRFPSPGTRGYHRPLHHGPQGSRDMHEQGNNDMDNYHYNRPRPQGQRQILPYFQQMMQKKPERRNAFDAPAGSNFHVNTMGDVDFRHSNNSQQPQPWSAPPMGQRQPKQPNQIYERRSYRKDSFEANRLPPSEYSGHRPHSSDYYGNIPTPVKENSNSFSHSIDDTVDIVRKKLLNRSEPQLHGEPSHHDDIHIREPQQETSNSYRHEQQSDSHSRKRTQWQKSNTKSNCDKMKNKIVHQLFKMDKDKIHKLMDNPNSSSKFEYAISSLITESQNSFNRHMRSVAEKSLCSSSSSEFVHNDNNTVYEDTFMKQMQCILDPQDTVLLEDIKPLVLAELSNLLQLDDYDQRFEQHDYNAYDNAIQQKAYDQVDNTSDFTSDNYDFQYADQDYRHIEPHNESESQASGNYPEHSQSPPECKPTFRRRSTHQEVESNENIPNSSIRRSFDQSCDRRRSFDKSKERIPTPVPLFDSNTAQFSEDEDPFAELDNQYHVAVDHNFIEADYNSPQMTPYNMNDAGSPNTTISTLESSFTPEKSAVPVEVKQELDSQLKELATSPLKLGGTIPSPNLHKEEDKNIDAHNIKQESTDSEIKNNDTNNKTTLPPQNARKRPSDQKPSHRKEKRKKSDASSNESSKQILNKNIIINVNDCASKTSEKCESAKSIFNLFFSKEESKKTNNQREKKTETSNKEYSDKYVKRKDVDKKNKSHENKKKHDALIPLHCSDTSLKQSKTDPKAKLQTFDIFEQQPRKVNLPPQPLRNTALAPTTPKATVGSKDINLASSRKTKRHTAVQTALRVEAKSIQTITPRRVPKATQTLPVTITKTHSTCTDALERMKEIDIEIQSLLKEKFKLYSSLETSSKAAAKMLGMTVLNVSPTPDIEEDSSHEDAIVEEFTNIPEEELEMIALESVQDELLTNKKTQKQKGKSRHRKNSKSPHTPVKKSGYKSKTPNISLIEQIITDDRSLEEIIPSIDELEKTPKSSKKPKKKTTSRKGREVSCEYVTNADSLPGTDTVEQTTTTSVDEHQVPTTKPKRKYTKKATHKRVISREYKTDVDNDIPALPETKECSVVLLREDLEKVIRKMMKQKDTATESPIAITETNEQSTVDTPIKQQVSHVEEVNDVQIDMLDVSEDIIIGDDAVCEVKDDKVVEQANAPLNEDILDNSQSSADEGAGQEASQSEELCKIYDYSADETLRRDATIVTGNADAVLAIECFDNDFIAACLDGNVYHFSGEGQLLNTLRGSNLPVTCVTIVKEKYGTTVYTGSLDSRIRYYDLETGLEKGPECNVLSPIQTMDRAWDTIFVGTRTGFVLQFECKNNMLIPVSTVKFSEQAILALRALKEGPRKVLLVAARSENVTIKDASTGLLLRTLEGPQMTVYTLLFEDGKVYCGTSSHQLHVFDYASGVHVGVHRGGKGAVCLRAAGGLVFAGCYDGAVYLYRDGDPAPRAVLRGPKLMLLALAVTDTKIIAGYKDRSLYIWKIPLAILQEMVL